MNNSYIKGYNIVSKLNINDSIDSSTLPANFTENSIFKNRWLKYGVVNINEVNGKKFLLFNNSSIIVNFTNIGTTLKQIFESMTIQFEAKFITNTFKNENILFTIHNKTTFYFNVSKNFIEINVANNSIKFAYNFEENKEYHIVFTKGDVYYNVFVNGLIVGVLDDIDIINKIDKEFKNINLPVSPTFYVSNDITTGVNGYIGQLNDISISIGYFEKYVDNYTKYGCNINSICNFGNLNYDNNIQLKEELVNFNREIEISDVNSKKLILKNGLNISLIDDNIKTIFLENLKIENIKNDTEYNINIFENDYYKFCLSILNSSNIIEPEVVVNEYTTSALDFENDLIDKIPTTVWQKEGTANITSDNKIFGENSFETKALGDSLYNNSNIITGGSTPFTIEFYALINKQLGWSDSNYILSPLISKNGNGASTNQQVHINFALGGKIQLEKQANTGGVLTSTGNINIKYNEINKYTISYDGSAYRFFVDDKLDHSVGTLNSFNMNMNQPFKFFDSLVPNYSQYRTSSKGIIDNINIHDGIATKVRDYDPYEEYLIVDLAFDGENNSTKIVDNGSLKSNWVVNGSAKISNTQKFDGFSSLNTINPSSHNSYAYANLEPIIVDDLDFTILVDFMLTSYNSDWSSAIVSSKLCNGGNGFCIAVASSESNRVLSIALSSENEYVVDLDKRLIGPRIEINKKYNVVVICKNNILSLYVNNILYSTVEQLIKTGVDLSLGGGIQIGKGGIASNGSNINVWNSSCNGYIKNFKIYKGVAVIPEDPTGKIQLDFDNNVIDKYGNSTWTNNGVTFDQVNSVKGYAAYFNNGSRISCGIDQNLNFEQTDHLVEFDCKMTTVNAWNDFIYSGVGGSASGVFYSSGGYIRHRFDGSNYYDTNVSLLSNNYYNYSLSRMNQTFINKINDVIISSYNSSTVMNYNRSNQTSIGANVLNGEYVTGYIDNFKSIKNYQEPVIIDRLAVQLPLETNAINTGFTPLTINSVGSPTYTTIDGKKCIKFESGKYLTINSNNIFNLGENSDFHMEFDFYTETTSNSVIYDSWSHGGTFQIMINNNMLSYYYGNYISTDIPVYINMWYKVKFYRKNAVVVIQLNDEIYTHTTNFNIYGSSASPITLGCQYQSTSYAMLGYMSNFKMFVGTHEPPETYNDKKVLDLDFAPPLNEDGSRASYLFKDNNNKCVIHPVKMDYRDYQDSQYCATFNGVDQYLQLGKNDALNFGLDDFIIEIVFKLSNYSTTTGLMLLSSAENSQTLSRAFISIESTTVSATRPRSLQILTTNSSGSSVGLGSSNDVLLNEINKVIITRNSSTLTINLNDVITTKNDFNEILNFNLSNNTYIGWRNYQNQPYFQGTIYSIKILRNTSDLSLLEDTNLESTSKFIAVDKINNIETEYEHNFDKNTNFDMLFNNTEPKIKVKSDDEIIDIEFEEIEEMNVSNVKLFDNDIEDVYDISINNIITYDIQLPEFDYINEEMYNADFIDINLPELEIEGGDINDNMSMDLHINSIGDFIIKGFIEGYEDRNYVIRNNTIDYELLDGVEYYEFDGISEYYIDDFEIIELDESKNVISRYPLYKHIMERGYIRGTVKLENCEVEPSDMYIHCYRNDNQRFIGRYEVQYDEIKNEYFYYIPNLDIHSLYDITFRDSTKKLEQLSSTMRTPKKY